MVRRTGQKVKLESEAADALLHSTLYLSQSRVRGQGKARYSERDWRIS